MTTIIPHNHPTWGCAVDRTYWAHQRRASAGLIGGDFLIENYLAGETRELRAVDGWTPEIANEFLDYVTNEAGRL